MKYNKLTILEEYKTRTKSGRSQRRLKCLCDCGKTTDVEKAKVINGITKSCGCVQKDTRINLGKSRRLPKYQASINEVFSVYKRSAKKRGLIFNLSKNDFIEIITGKCIYCGDAFTNVHNKKFNYGNFQYTGIDRYDNNLGYVKENCVSCCSICNRIKTNMSVEELKNRIIKILNNIDVWQRTE